MSRLFIASSLLFLSMFVFVEIAEARLIRSPGRGVRTEQVQTDYYFIQNSDIVRFENSIGMSQSAYDNRFSLLRSGIGGGGRGVSAVPTSGSSSDNDCNGSYTQDTLQGFQDEVDFWLGSNDPNAQARLAEAQAALENLVVGTPCRYEINQGDGLTAFGPLQVFFDSDFIDHVVTWNIFGDSVDKSIDGRVNEGAPIMTPDGVIENGEVMLEALWSQLALEEGEYELEVNVDVTSALGEFLVTVQNTGTGNSAIPVNFERHEENNPAWDAWVDARNEWQINVYDVWLDGGQIGPEPIFELPEPPETLVGYRSIDDDGNYVSSSMSFTSAREILMVLPLDNDDPNNPVNAPATVIFSLFSGVVLLTNRRRLKTTE